MYHFKNLYLRTSKYSRFLTDDRRELQYRVAIQNKVYRREVAALDLEIGRLERQLLEINSVSCSSSTSSITTMPRKMDMYAVEEGNVNYQQQQQYQHPRTPSIGGGLPQLLLSVLPPVIPRASLPSAVQELSMRRSVTFSSEPKLDEQHNKQRSQSHNRQPAIDLYNLCLRPERFNEKLCVLGRIKNFFGSRTSIRKSSAASYIDNSNIGIASALKVHMGYLAGLVPGSQQHQSQNIGSSNEAPSGSSVSCNTSSTAIHRLTDATSMSNSRDLYARRQSYARGCGSGPIISVTSDSTDTLHQQSHIYTHYNGADSKDNDNEIDPSNNESKRKFSLGMCLQGRREQQQQYQESSKMNFSIIPLQKRKSITHQNSQPVLSFRERAKGSPRFPHRIVPTCSLNALEDRRKSMLANSLINYSRRK
ncbi:metabotropic GABA-B receptor subtype 3 [Carabus blaptoides fortunei]